MEIKFNEGVSPTTHGVGPFHPAIRNGSRVYYWPNITFETEDEAYQRASESLAGALWHAIDQIRNWNVWEAK